MSLPATYNKFVVKQLSSNFREATEVVQTALKPPVKNQVLIKVHYAGINASDINFTAGRYTAGAKPPFDAGFEAVGTVVAKGETAQILSVGDSVVFSAYGAFTEYIVLPEKAVRKVPAGVPAVQMLPLLVSGLTASIALAEVGQMKSGETVMVTAAAGGTGLFAVQLAKLAGNHVIGTCSSDDKVALLKKLGCDRVINYRKENVANVLKTEYPKGVNVVYESVGGKMLETCIKGLSVKGRLILIGMISGYQDQSAFKAGKNSMGVKETVWAELLRKSASVRGFFLNDYAAEVRHHLPQLMKLVASGQLKSVVDPTPFVGLASIPDAIDYMYSGKNVGKVVVCVDAAMANKSNQIRSKL